MALGGDKLASRNQKAMFSKIATMIEDVADDRAAWMADLLIGSVPGIEWDDKMGRFALVCHDPLN